MKKSSVKLLAGAGVLVVIFGGYYALRQYNAREEERTAAEEAYRETIMEVTPEDVEGVSFEIEGTETTFYKSGDIWKMEGDDTFPVYTEKISEVLSCLAPLQTLQQMISLQFMWTEVRTVINCTNKTKSGNLREARKSLIRMR